MNTKAACSRSVVLLASETHLVRQALIEAIESTETILDSGLPPSQDMFSKRDVQIHLKWSARIKAYRQLLEKLGGEIPDDFTSGQEVLR